MDWRISCWAGGVFVACWSNPANAEQHSSNAATNCSAMIQEEAAPRAVAVMRASSCFVDQKKYALAARLLQKRLEEMENQQQEGGKAAVENKLQMVLSHVAAFDLKTEVNAEILVDGVMLGRHPDVNPLFLEPGKHEVIARSGTRQTSFKIDAIAGSLAPLELKLASVNKPTAIGPVTSFPLQSSPLRTNRENTRWTAPRIATIAIAGSLSVTGLVLGIGFTSAAQHDESRRARIVNSFPLKTQQCAVLPNLTECDRVKILVDQRDLNQRIGIIGFVATGASIATIMTALVWPAKLHSKETRGHTKTMFIVPRGAGAEFGFVSSF